MIRARKKQLVQLHRLGLTRETHPRCSIRKEGRKGTAHPAALKEGFPSPAALVACTLALAASSPEGQQQGNNGGHGARQGSSCIALCRKPSPDTEVSIFRTVPEAAPAPAADGAEALPTTVPDCFAPLRLRLKGSIGMADAKGQSRQDTGEDRARTPPQQEQEQLEDTAGRWKPECRGWLEDTGLCCCFPALRSAGVVPLLLPRESWLPGQECKQLDRVGGRGETFLQGCDQIETLGRCGLFPSFLPSFYSCLVSCVMVVCCPALVKRPRRRSLALCSAAKSNGRNCSPSLLQ